MGKKTLILGASTNPSRFSYLAAHKLVSKGHDIVPAGLKKGSVAGKEMLDIREKPLVEGIDTITLYMNPVNQKPYYDYILSLNPGRIIFNPGTENPELMALAAKNNIETEENCTLIMLNTGIY